MSVPSAQPLPFAIAAQDKEGVFAAKNPEKIIGAAYAVSFISDEAKFAASQMQAMQAPKPQQG